MSPFSIGRIADALAAASHRADQPQNEAEEQDEKDDAKKEMQPVEAAWVHHAAVVDRRAEIEGRMERRPVVPHRRAPVEAIAAPAAVVVRRNAAPLVIVRAGAYRRAGSVARRDAGRAAVAGRAKRAGAPERAAPAGARAAKRTAGRAASAEETAPAAIRARAAERAAGRAPAGKASAPERASRTSERTGAASKRAASERAAAPLRCHDIHVQRQQRRQETDDPHPQPLRCQGTIPLCHPMYHPALTFDPYYPDA